MPTNLDLRFGPPVRMVDHANAEPAQTILDRSERRNINLDVGRFLLPGLC